jgi:hypothetical protein
LGIGTVAAVISRRLPALPALLSGGTLAELSVGTIVGIYLAHLAVEAVLVGGVYYYWPSERAPDDDPSRSMKLRLPPPPNVSPAPDSIVPARPQR